MITENCIHVIVIITQDNYDILGTLKHDETIPAYLQAQIWMKETYPLLKNWHYVIRDLVE